MKKGLKKQIEHELSAIIEKTLSGHNKHAVAKTKKIIKEASKTVGKKFIKSLKSLAEKKKGGAKGKKKSAPKVKANKEVTFKHVKSRKRVHVRHTPKKIALPKQVESNGQTAENLLERN